MALGQPARHLDAVGSTMTEAAAWAADGAPHGALVTARTQTAGRGRHGRAWLDAPGDSLLLSLVLRPGTLGLPTERLGLIALAAGLALAEAVRALGADAVVKWPNDVVVDGRKLAGVLAEARSGAGGIAVVLGVGLNVAQTGFPPEVADRATSLRLATGTTHDTHAPLAPFLQRLDAALARAADDAPGLVAAVEARLVGRGQPVTVSYPGTPRPPVSGTVRSLAPDGGLVLATPGGEVTVHAGEVTVGA